jgi:glutamine amidotransferase
MIAIVDYGVGNPGSIHNMLLRLGMPSIITSDPSEIDGAGRLILPGVGSFDTAMRNLNANGLASVISEAALTARKPVLGICLGMQIMTCGSEEGSLPGLGWIDAETVRFQFDASDRNLRIPHMGWNTAVAVRESALLQGVPRPSRFYFVHSYYVRCACDHDVLAKTTYGTEFASAIGRDNIFGVQFHPEKSHRYGMEVLRAFAHIT